MSYEEIHSPEEMAEFIVKTANKYNVKQITLCAGYRHTIIYNYDVMECNFMVEHDMTVVNEKGNKYKLNPYFSPINISNIITLVVARIVKINVLSPAACLLLARSQPMIVPIIIAMIILNKML